MVYESDLHDLSFNIHYLPEFKIFLKGSLFFQGSQEVT